MTSPQRVQMSRQRPWRAQHPDAVIVARPSKWGNPYKVDQRWSGGATGGPVYVVRPEPAVAYAKHHYHDETAATERAVHLYRTYLTERLERESLTIAELSGRDLACWCPLDQPCHADVLLELANGARP